MNSFRRPVGVNYGLGFLCSDVPVQYCSPLVQYLWFCSSCIMASFWLLAAPIQPHLVQLLLAILKLLINILPDRVNLEGDRISEEQRLILHYDNYLNI